MSEISRENILCMDIGTSSIKAGLVSASGTLLWGDQERILQSPHDIKTWNAESWLRGIKALASRRRRDVPCNAIAISGNGPTLVAMDVADTPIRPVLLWLDSRDERLADQPSFFLPKVAWLRQHHPELFERTRRFLSCPEYINYVLTGNASTITPTREFQRYIWDESQIDAYGLDPALFPPFVRPADRVGKVTRKAAAEFGLPEDTPVFAAGSDFLMSLVGTGTVKPGRTCDRAGTSEGINHCSVRRVSDPRLRVLPHIARGTYNVAGILASTGRIFEWYRAISRQRDVSYQQMLSEISAVPFARHIPWFFPSIHQGAAWEFSRGMFIELGASHASAEMGRAVVESIGYAVRESVDILEANECNIEELRACGGQAKNAIWNQMKADITGKTVSVVEIEDAELLGNACTALTGLGEFGSVEEASLELVRFRSSYAPRADIHEIYNDRYHTYMEAYRSFASALKESSAL